MGQRYCKEHHDHSTPFRRAIEYDCIDPKTSIQVDMRGGLFDESDFDFANDAGLEHIYAVDIHHMGIEKTAELIRKKVGNNKVMVTFDIDFVDPALLPVQALPFPVDLLQDKLLNLFVMRLSVLILLALTLLKSHRTMTQGE